MAEQALATKTGEGRACEQQTEGAQGGCSDVGAGARERCRLRSAGCCLRGRDRRAVDWDDHGLGALVLVVAAEVREVDRVVARVDRGTGNGTFVAGRLIRGIVVLVRGVGGRRVRRRGDHRRNFCLLDLEDERQRGRVTGLVEDDDRVGAFDRAEHSGLDVVHVTPRVVDEVLDLAVQLDPVDVLLVGQLEADRLVDAILPDGFGLDGDDRVGVVDGPRRDCAGVVTSLVPGADLDLVLAVGELGRVDGEVERVRVQEFLTGDLLPFAVDQLLELHVRTSRVGLVLGDVERLHAVDQVPRGDVDHRCGGVDHEGDDGGVARDVVDDELVDALDCPERPRLEAVDVRVGVVAEVLEDPVDGHLVDLVEVVELEADVLEDAVRPDGFGLDGDARSDVVDREAERGAGLVVGLVPGADLDLRRALGVEGGVDREVGHVRVVEPGARELDPLAARELLEFHVGLGRVGLDLGDVEGLDAVDQTTRGGGDGRLRRVQHEGVRRLVAECVFEHEGVEALDCTERPRRDAVEIRVLVRRQRLDAAVEGRRNDLRGIEELVADVLVEPARTDETVLDRSGRAGRVEHEGVAECVAGDVEDDDRVGSLDCAERARLDAVHVTVDVVREVLDDAVDLDLVDLFSIVQREADGGEAVVRALGTGRLDGQLGGGGVGGDQCDCDPCHFGRGCSGGFGLGRGDCVFCRHSGVGHLVGGDDLCDGCRNGCCDGRGSDHFGNRRGRNRGGRDDRCFGDRSGLYDGCLHDRCRSGCLGSCCGGRLGDLVRGCGEGTKR